MFFFKIIANSGTHKNHKSLWTMAKDNERFKKKISILNTAELFDQCGHKKTKYLKVLRLLTALTFIYILNTAEHFDQCGHRCVVAMI